MGGPAPKTREGEARGQGRTIPHARTHLLSRCEHFLGTASPHRCLPRRRLGAGQALRGGATRAGRGYSSGPEAGRRRAEDARAAGRWDGIGRSAGGK